MSILEFNNVKKENLLGETTVRVLRGVDLTVGKGRVHRRAGRFGWRKTLLL
jgi:ABC-type lipoprotein export system ATPase subunit